jgi:HAD superfamily phosphatase (TIGR01668 family)
VHVSDIDLERLRGEGIEGFIFDLDDTLVHALEPQADAHVLAWIAELKAKFHCYVVSNNFSPERVAIAADHLGLPYLAKARKPSRRFFRKAMAEMGLPAAKVAIVGDQLFTDVLGGNRMGAFTILVDPLSKERKWHRKVMRSIETYMLTRGDGTPYHDAKERP